MVGIEAILLDLFPTFVLGTLALLAFAPEEDATQYQQSDNNDGDDDSNGCLAAGADTARVVLLRILQLGRIGVGRVSGACTGRRCAVGWQCSTTSLGKGSNDSDDLGCLSSSCRGGCHKVDRGKDLGGWRSRRGRDDARVNEAWRIAGSRCWRRRCR